jgi:GTP-binding protein LepA
VVFVSFYAEDQNQYDNLRNAFQKLKLNDSALKIQEDFNEALGRGFKIGFLGKLHFEITAERLEKEFFVKTVNTFPSVAYKMPKGSKYEMAENPSELPDSLDGILEPMIKMEVMASVDYLGLILKLKDIYRWEEVQTENFGDNGERIIISFKMPLAELISDFDSQLKSVSAGFASYNYEMADFKPSNLAKLKILVAGNEAAGLVRVVPQDKLIFESKKMVERLKELLPRQQFMQALQAVSGGKILARENIPAMKKDVTGYLYGGDRSRKMKLWKKQKRGKKKLLQMSSGVKIPVQVFKDLLK